MGVGHLPEREHRGNGRLHGDAYELAGERARAFPAENAIGRQQSFPRQRARTNTWTTELEAEKKPRKQASKETRLIQKPIQRKPGPLHVCLHSKDSFQVLSCFTESKALPEKGVGDRGSACPECQLPCYKAIGYATPEGTEDDVISNKYTLNTRKSMTLKTLEKPLCLFDHFT